MIWLNFKMYRKGSKNKTNEIVINYYDEVPMCPILKYVRNNRIQQYNFRSVS